MCYANTAVLKHNCYCLQMLVNKLNTYVDAYIFVCKHALDTRKETIRTFLKTLANNIELRT